MQTHVSLNALQKVSYIGSQWLPLFLQNSKRKSPILTKQTGAIVQCHDTMIQVRYRKVPLSQKSAGHMQNRKTKTNTNPSPDPNRYRRRCPDPNARIQKFIHYMAIATFVIVDLCDSGPLR